MTAVAADWLRLVRFSHTVFALPFALIAALVASDGRPEPLRLAAVVLAVVCARTSAMAYNRYADRDLDARNERTRGRELPRGVLTPRAVLLLAIGAAIAFLALCAWLGPAPLALAAPVLAVLLGYSHAKRFTALCHFWLGLALGLAPPAAWVAMTGGFAGFGAPILLGLGVLLWVAGFDLLYACQDVAFDRDERLHSVPVRLGVAGALRLARVCHVLALPAFAAFGLAASLGPWWHAAVVVSAAFLLREHWLLRGGGLARMQQAFFVMNAMVSVTLLAGAVVALYL